MGVLSVWICMAVTRSAFTQDSKPTESAAPANPSKAECAAAYEAAQESRAAGQLRKTRERLEFCAQPECPSFVQRDCSRWFSEVERELPSVRISARDWEGAPAGDLQVSLDGERLQEPLADRPISIDPGQHEFVFERTGHPKITRTIVAQQGVQNRVLVVDFGPPNEGVPADRAQPSGSASLKPYAYAGWALGAVGIGTFAIMGTIGRSDKRALEDDCPTLDPTPGAVSVLGVSCIPADVDARNSTIDREFLFADIGLVVGLIGAVGGTVLFLVSPSSKPATPSAADAFDLDLQVTRGGARATVGGHF